MCDSFHLEAAKQECGMQLFLFYEQYLITLDIFLPILITYMSNNNLHCQLVIKLYISTIKNAIPKLHREVEYRRLHE